jgi:hypothetical protein
MTRTLDRLSEFALLLGGNGGDAAWDDLTTFRDKALKQADILIINFRRVFGGEN